MWKGNRNVCFGSLFLLKYAYIPVSLKELFLAKLAVIGKRIGKSAFVVQIFALIGCGIDFELMIKEGELIYISAREMLVLFTPVWCGILIFLMDFRGLYKSYKEALKG